MSVSAVSITTEPLSLKPGPGLLMTSGQGISVSKACMPQSRGPGSRREWGSSVSVILRPPGTELEYTAGEVNRV